LVVVVRDRFPTWALILVILLVLVAVAILTLVITGGRGTVFVVAIPAFPPESIVIGLLVGVLLLALKRKSASPGRTSNLPPAYGVVLLGGSIHNGGVRDRSVW